MHTPTFLTCPKTLGPTGPFFEVVMKSSTKKKAARKKRTPRKTKPYPKDIHVSESKWDGIGRAYPG